MTLIQTLPPDRPGTPLHLAARTLFLAYGDFLRATQSCGYFDPDAFEHEIATLPAPYTDQNGELLLALVEDAGMPQPTDASPTPGAAAPSAVPPNPAACIAFRAGTYEGPLTAEIKRLFVLPAFRSRGLARTLVAEALARAAARGFTRAVLDTDLVHMPGAAELYASFGFEPYSHPRYGTRKDDIAFFARPLP